MQFKARPEIKRTRIEIIPMIDTMFFLLVFFMLSSLALVKLNSLPVNLPQAATGQKQQVSDLTVTVDDKGQVFVNKDPVSLDDVGQVVVQKAGAGADMSKLNVILNVDLTVQHGIVVRLMDECRLVGVTKFSIATKPEKSS